MPEMTPSPAAGAPVPPPGAGGGAAPPTPPMGSSPATGPTANKGMEAAGLQKLGLVVRGLEQLLPMFGATSDIGQAVMSAIKSLAKHVPPGAVTPAAEKNQIEQLAMRHAQQGQQMQALRPPPGAGGPGAGGVPTPPGA